MRIGKSFAFFEPLGSPGFVTSFTDPDGVVGVEFFEQWTAANGWTMGPDSETPGLFGKLESLDSAAFAAGEVHPLVRTLYERTTGVEFIANRPMWTPLGWAMHTFYYRVIAHRMRQLNAPLVDAWFPTNIKSVISPLRKIPGDVAKFRSWVRTYETAGSIFYTAAVFDHGASGWFGSQRYLVAVLPLKYASMTVVFQPQNLPNGGFAIDTENENTYEAGTYLVLPGKRHYSMLPAFVRDQIRLHPRRDESGEYLEGEHRTWGFGVQGYTIPYTIRARPQQQAVEHAENAAAGTPVADEAGASSMDAAQLPQRATVIVAGGGPAGLAAASALSRRGINVLLVESAPAWGGKAYTERDADGRALGHGVHGWWPSYLNFDALLTTSSIEPIDVLRPARQGGLLLDSGDMADLRNSFVLLPSPLHLFSSLKDLGITSLSELLELARFSLHVLAFDHQRDYAKYDGMSLTEFGERTGVSAKAMDLFLRPFAFSFDYAQAEEVSASSILSAMQFYMLPSATAMQPRWSRGLEHERIFDPLANALEKSGAVVMRSTTLESVVIKDGKVTSATVLRMRPGDSETEVARVAIDTIPQAGFLSVPSPAGNLWVGRRSGEDFVVFSSVCPHLNGPLLWGNDEFHCPWHNSYFRPDGTLKKGPSKRGMDRVRFERRDHELVIFAHPGRRTVDCQHVVLAGALPQVRKVLEASTGVPERLKADLAYLKTTPVIVIRLWFRAEAPIPSDRESIVLPRGDFADVLFHLNALGQSRDRDGIAVEMHCASSGEKARWNAATDQAVIDAALADLATIAPGLEAAHLHPDRQPVLQRHGDTFTLYAPGDASRRPGAQTGITGLSLAGDWTRADWSVWMMERAVVSGIRAANVVLETLGREQAPIERLPREGLLLSAARLLARLVRAVFPRL